MTERHRTTEHVLDSIDRALLDYSVSGDAMRWQPDPIPDDEDSGAVEEYGPGDLSAGGWVDVGYVEAPEAQQFGLFQTVDANWQAYRQEQPLADWERALVDPEHPDFPNPAPSLGIPRPDPMHMEIRFSPRVAFADLTDVFGAAVTEAEPGEGRSPA